MEQNKHVHLLPENIVNLEAATVDRVQLPVINNHNITLDVLRLDKIHPIISGNKWFKLQYYLEAALQHRQKTVLTFGGAWSNHIIATACAARTAGLQSIGIIRGEKPAQLSSTLQDAAQMGMQLVFINRQVYNQKKDPAFIERLMQEYDHPCIIPEGGEGDAGIQGAAGILRLADTKAFSHIICAVGTGTLLAGLVIGAAQQQQIIGIPVLKGFENWSPPGIALKDQQGISIVTDYHFGGYAKKNNALLNFMNQWYTETGIPTDFVYTGKLFFAISDLIKKGYFSKGCRLLAIHSGGLQGNKSLPVNALNF